MAASAKATKRSASKVAPVVAPVEPTPITVANRPNTCGALYELTHDEAKASAGCRRLPRHHGDHVAAKPRGLMTLAERARIDAQRLTKAAAAKVAPPQFATVTLKGQKFLVPLDKAGAPVFAKASPVVAEREHGVKASAAKVAPKVRTIPMAKSPRRVASSSGR